MHEIMSKSPTILDNVRQFILDEVVKAGRNVSLKALSIAAGKNPAYIHQFIYRGSPRHLPEDVRYKVASYLGVSERRLRHQADNTYHDNVVIAYLDHPSQMAHVATPWHIPRAFLMMNWAVPAHNIRIAMVGDNTADLNITSGDVVMLDLMDRSPLRSGYFALDAGSHIRVRHLEQISVEDPTIIISGNGANRTANSSYTCRDLAKNIIGRVIFHAHMFTPSSAPLGSYPTPQPQGSLS